MLETTTQRDPQFRAFSTTDDDNDRVPESNFDSVSVPVEVDGNPTPVRWRYSFVAASSEKPAFVNVYFDNRGRRAVRFAFRAFLHAVDQCPRPPDDDFSRKVYGVAEINGETTNDSYYFKSGALVSRRPETVAICVWNYEEM